MKSMNGRVTAAGDVKPFYAVRNDKFPEEKVCRETEELLIQFEGIALSAPRPRTADERIELLRQLYLDHGPALPAFLKGQYQLLIWDKRAGKLLIANDALSKRPVYYCLRDRELLYAGSYYDMLALLGEDGFAPTLNADAFRSMATQGLLNGTDTYLREVRFLGAYESLTVDLEPWNVQLVRTEPQRPWHADTMDQAVEIFDELFSRAVRAQFEKNREYDRLQLATLSGGMDSRSVLLQGLREGWTGDIVCVNYSQSGSVDHRVSQQIAMDHGLDYLHYPMDAAVFLTRLDDAMDANECQQSGFGATGARTVSRLLDLSRAGILHAGICGGELMGDLVYRESTGSSGVVKRAIRTLGLETGECRFPMELYLDNTRVCRNLPNMFLDRCETVSPFLDEDVVAFVTGLDPKFNARRALYRAWMCAHLPNDYPTTYFYGPITISPFREVVRKAGSLAARRLLGRSRREMNPLPYWIQTHKPLEERLLNEYAQGMEELERRHISPEIREILCQGWQGDWFVRLQTLTALRAARDVLDRVGKISE